MTFDLLFALMDVTASAVAKPGTGATPAQVTEQLLAAHPDARLDAGSAALTLPPVNSAALAAATTIEALGTALASQTGVGSVTIRKTGDSITIIGSINPDVTLAEAQIPNFVGKLQDEFKAAKAWFTREDVADITFNIAGQTGKLTPAQVDKLIGKARGQLVETETIEEDDGTRKQFYAFTGQETTRYPRNQERLDKRGDNRFAELTPKWTADIIDSPSSDIRDKTSGVNVFKTANLTFVGDALPQPAKDELAKDTHTTAAPMGKTQLTTAFDGAREPFQKAAAGNVTSAPVLSKANAIAVGAGIDSSIVSKIEYVDDGGKGKISVPGKAEAEIKLQQGYAATPDGEIPQVLRFLMAMARDSKPAGLTRAEFTNMWNEETPTARPIATSSATSCARSRTTRTSRSR